MFKSFFHISLFSLIVVLFSNCNNSRNEKNNTIEFVEEVVNINGVDHYIKKIGTGEPLIVLHGGPGLFHNYLVPHFEKLSKKHQIIFYDQRGCGQTAFPTDTSTISLEKYVSDLESIRNHLKLNQLSLIAHSWGSVIALNYGKHYPEHLERLVLISPAPTTTEFFDATFSNMQKKRKEEDTKELVQLMMSKNYEKKDGKTFKKALTLGDKINLNNPDNIEQLYAPMSFDETTANHLLLVNSMMEHLFFEYDAKQDIKAIECPTLIVYGASDNVPLASAEYIKDNIENAQVSVIKNACHYPFFESPEEFNVALDHFLNPNDKDGKH